MLERKDKQIGYLSFYSFYCFKRCWNSKHHSPSMPKFHLLFTGSFAVDNCRGSFVVLYRALGKALHTGLENGRIKCSLNTYQSVHKFVSLISNFSTSFQTLANRHIPLTEHHIQLPLVYEKCQVWLLWRYDTSVRNIPSWFTKYSCISSCFLCCWSVFAINF